MAYIIHAVAKNQPFRRTPLTPKGKKFTLEELQAAIGGGYIESVPGTGGRAYCDEDGRSKQLPYNEEASLQYSQGLLGDVVVLEQADKQ